MAKIAVAKTEADCDHMVGFAETEDFEMGLICSSDLEVDDSIMLEIQFSYCPLCGVSL